MAWLSPRCYVNRMNDCPDVETQTQTSRNSTLTHWSRVTHICVSKPTSIGSDNGLSPGRRQAIIWINAGILLIGPLGTNFSEILIEIYTFSFKKMHMKMAAILSWPQCVNLFWYMLNTHLNSAVTSFFIYRVQMKLCCSLDHLRILHHSIVCHIV